MESLAYFLAKYRKHTAPVYGFTLVELMVSLGIMMIITSIVILGQASFNKNLVLIDTSYTVASTVREAQIFGLSSKKTGNIQNAGYGVHFDTSSNTSYRLFADIYPAAPGSSLAGKCAGHVAQTGVESKPGNCAYDSSTELITTYTLNGGFKIARFCGFDANGNKLCSTTSLSAIDITFLRPSTQATIIATQSGSPTQLVSAAISVSSPDGSQERCINVTTVGQVAVGNCP